MTTRLLGLSIVALLVVGACSRDGAEPVAPEPEVPGSGLWEGMIEAQFVRDSLTLKNQTEHTVGYVVIEKNMAIVAMFPPCTGNCQTLVPGASAAVAIEDIAGVTPDSREVQVLWWSYDRAGVPTGGMSTSVVRLPER
jgi:hypothetical protein